LRQQLLAGTYRLGAVDRFWRDGEPIEVWQALDSLVLKAVAIVLSRRLDSVLSRRCFHLAGRGGAKAAVRAVAENLDQNQWVMRTDVKSYYASIQHDVLMDIVRAHVADVRVVDLIDQYVRRNIYEDGIYETPTCGICLGCPLSPLMGALFLQELDRRMEDTGLCYARFMDDWVILAPTRWKLRQAVRIVNQVLADRMVRQHPDKTFIGRIRRGFEFLGYAFATKGLTGIARTTRQRFFERVTQLYEQGADEVRIGQYVRRWWKWTTEGVRGEIRVEWARNGIPLNLAYLNGVLLPLSAER